MSKGVLVVSEDAMKVVRLDEKGREVPDSTRPVIPLGFKKPESLNDMVQRFVRHAISVQAAEKGYESFEDAEDFDVDGEDALPDTPYEVDFDPVLGKDVSLAQLRDHERKVRYAQKAGVTKEVFERVRKRSKRVSEKASGQAVRVGGRDPGVEDEGTGGESKNAEGEGKGNS